MKNNIINLLVILFVVFFVVGCDVTEDVMIDDTDESKEIIVEDANSGNIDDKIVINKIDNNNYEFVYDGETFKVLYLTDTWKIYNSYKITNSSDIKKICQALIDIHPIHGIDLKSYRTSEDMTYEWLQHNLAYQVLPDGNSFRNSAKDVDLDPKDQGKSLVEMYEDRTGHKLDLKGFIK